MLCVALTGCGGAYDATVSGAVTMDGDIVNSGVIAYIPSAGGPSAYARIDKSGNYDVYTGKERGLPPGNYQVTVVSREPPPVSQTEGGGPPPAGKALTPAWYAQAQYTPLQFQVEPGDNDINLELTSTPPANWQPPPRRR